MIILMINLVGKVGTKEIVVCRGFDAVRGIIGREGQLVKRVFVFLNCPMVHAYFVRASFFATFVTRDGRVIGHELIRPNSLSGFYQFSALCLESNVALLPEEIKKIYSLVLQLDS